MDRERWRTLQELLSELWSLEAEERESFLDRHCPDPGLRREIEELLAAGEEADGYLGSLAGRMGMNADGEAAQPNLSGRQVGNYRLLEPLGHGGMGVVYLAERADGEFDTRVAVKLLAMGVSTPEAHARFLAERQILADLKHPAIAGLLDGGVAEDGTPYFVMELVEGERIDRWCNERGLDIEARLRLMVRVCEAVEAAHRRLIVHRDLKPANIMVSDGHESGAGQPKLLDFGVAKVLSEADAGLTQGLTRSHQAPATPAWAAPEQLAGDPITTATDTYALGAVLYALLVDVAAYDLQGKSSTTVLEQLRSQPTAPSRRFASLSGSDQNEIASARGTTPAQLRRRLDGDLDAILQRALSPEPERRYGSAAALAEDLERHLAGHPVHARPPSIGYRARRFIARHRWGVAATALVAVSLLAGATVALWQARVARAERDQAQAVTEFMKGLFRASDPDEAQGREVSARELLDLGAARLDTTFEDRPELQGEMLVLLGDLYRDLGELEDARPLLERGLAMAETSPDVDRQAAVLQALAQLDMEDGRHEEALAGLERAEELLRRTGHVPGVQHGALMTPLLFSMTELGKVDEAVQHGRAMLALARSDSDLPARALYDYLFNTARALSIAQHSEEAATLLREVQELGLDDTLDPSVRLAFHSQIGSVLASTGDLEEAVNHLRSAVTIAEEIYPPGHATSARQLSNLGSILNALGRIDEAEDALRRAIAIYERIYAEAPHPRVAAAHNNLGQALKGAGRYAAAEVHMARARDLAGELFGVDDHRYAIATANLGDLQRRLGNLTFAEALLVESQDRRRSSLGPEHPAVGNGLSLLAALRLDQGRPAEALELTDQALALYQRAGYRNPTYLLAAMTRRAQALAALGRVDQAQTGFAEALDLGESAGTDAGRVWPRLLAGHAEFLVSLDDPAAPAAVERALEASREMLGGGHPATQRLEALKSSLEPPDPAHVG